MSIKFLNMKRQKTNRCQTMIKHCLVLDIFTTLRRNGLSIRLIRRIAYRIAIHKPCNPIKTLNNHAKTILEVELGMTINEPNTQPIP